MLCAGNLAALNVDRNFKADRTGGRGKRGGYGGLHHAHGGMRIPDPEHLLGHALQHLTLLGDVMDRRTVAIGELQVHLCRDVQQRRARRQRLDLPTGRVARCGARRSHHDTKLPGHPRMGICQVHRTGLAPRGDETDPTLFR